MDACPTGALTFGEESDLKDLIAKAELLKPEAGTKPRTYYIDLPNKYFIAGAVYDPEADECLEGATVTLVSAKTGATATLTTDDFGDFWFERQEPGKYSLRIEKNGYTSATLDSIEADKDVNVGDIQLHAEAARLTMGEVTRYTNLTTGGPVHVDVKDGKILRIVPLELDESDGPSWTIHARGRDFTPPRRTTLAPYIVSNRSHVYSPKRILTPLKRVDFDPKGAPGSTGPGGRNAQNRGTSGYEPITWDEALDITASEIERVHREQGPAGILTSPGSHHLWGVVGYRHSTYFRFMNLIGYTYGEHNPDSWEGWHWGGMHMWGFSHRLGIPEQYDLLEDALQNTELMVFWSADPESTGGGIYTAYESTPRRKWLKELGRQDDLHRPLLQPHRRTRRRQVVRASPGHRRGLRSGYRAHLAHRGHLRQRIRGHPHRGLRLSGRPTCWARATASPRRPSGPRASAAYPPARSAPWRGSGAPRRPCWPPAARAASAGPAAPPPATSGRAP